MHTSNWIKFHHLSKRAFQSFNILNLNQYISILCCKTSMKIEKCDYTSICYIISPVRTITVITCILVTLIR